MVIQSKEKIVLINLLVIRVYKASGNIHCGEEIVCASGGNTELMMERSGLYRSHCKLLAAGGQDPGVSYLEASWKSLKEQ